MRTRKAISTISYNTKEYLVLVLNGFFKAKIISFWAAIYHKAEDDEAGKKDHFHVYIEPSGMLQTDDLREEFKEFDPLLPDKPKGCLKFISSKFDDWCLYVLHDKAYLASKGQSRKYHYSYDEFLCSDDDDLLMMYRSIDRMSLSPYASMIDAQNQGLSFAEYFNRGTVPLPQLALYQKAWDLLLSLKTFRNGRSGHDEDYFVDEETGEYINTDDMAIK